VFTVHGTVDAHAASVTWDEGRLDGDADVVVRAHLAVDLGEQVHATPSGPSFHASLDGPDYVACLTICQHGFDRVDRVDGEVSDVPGTELPPGAVA
jgi:hypothetical protein